MSTKEQTRFAGFRARSSPLVPLHLIMLVNSADVLVNECNGLALPVVDYCPSVHSIAETIRAWLKVRSIEAHPIHDDQEQGYCVLELRGRVVSGRLVSRSLDNLLRPGALSTNQHRLLALCLERLTRPSELFDNATNVTNFENWAADSLVALGRTVRYRPTVLKHRRDRRTLAFEQHATNQAYAKSHANVWREANITRALHAASPRDFVEELAVHERQLWWLYQGITGRTLRAIDLTPTRASVLGRAIARIQQATRTDLVRAAVAGTVTHADLVDLSKLAQAIASHALAVGSVPACCTDRLVWQTVAESVEGMRNVPHGLIHADLGFGNIVDRDGEYRLIDMEGAYWGPVPMILGRLVARLASVAPVTATTYLVGAYRNEWQDTSLNPFIAPRHVMVLDFLLKTKRSLDRLGVKASERLTHYICQRLPWPRGYSILELLRAGGHQCSLCVTAPR